ncbi:MAG: aldo/keto reductase [Omnitrophica WOR_2 bacterium RIFCSPHIGHO2_02_FULL_68_15]|nr:MAG: aldo/keto reductase [Omnitrophica WOR_2 bacterium RIFCSPHIGHO2_02_FULL_68_15]
MPNEQPTIEHSLPTRPFGRLGWEIAALGYGSWGLGGGWGPQDDAEGARALQRALALGVNFFDTAYVYGNGHSEQLLGRALKGWKRSPVYLATKVPAKTMEWPAKSSTPPARAFPTDWIIRCTETSLKRLGVETIDLQQLHVWTDAWVKAEEWRKAVERLKRDGKIRAFGVSINDHEPESALRLVATGEIDAVQVIYNVFEQSPEARLFPLCQEHGVSVIARVPFDEGSLTGALTPQTRFPNGDWRAGYFKGARLAETVERVERLKAFLRPGLPSVSALALQFAIGHPAVSVVIPGMRRVSHVDANVAAAVGGGLTAEERLALRAHAWPRNFYQGAWD